MYSTKWLCFKEFILTIIKKYNWILQYISTDLKNDKEFILKCVEQCCNSLFYTSNELKNNPEFILACIQLYYYILS